MRSVRVLIVDDEPLARRGIRQLLPAFREFAVVGECRNGLEAVQAIDALSPDLVFLDVQMPGLDGLGVVRRMGPGRMPITIFVTAYDDFAVAAFEAAAVDYLVKPLVEDRFREAIERVRERIQLQDVLSLARSLTDLLGRVDDRSSMEEALGRSSPDPRTGDSTIRVPTATGELFLDAEEIDWVESDDDCVRIHAGKREYLVRASLSGLEERLDPAHFARIHRTAVVRLDQVREWKTTSTGREAVVILRDGKRLPVSRRRLAMVKSRLRSSGK